ncbi:MFS transporter, partial [Enterococcus faecium]|nr:MFS transporter [Enterococcus faecium]
ILLLISALISLLVVHRTNRKTVIRVDEEIKEQLTTK